MTQITNIPNEIGCLQIDSTDIKSIVRECNEQFYTHINLTIYVKWTTFSKKHKLSSFTQYETDHLNNLIVIKKIKFIILKLPKKNSSGSGNFIGEFY